jgi:hypothetical protein
MGDKDGAGANWVSTDTDLIIDLSLIAGAVLCDVAVDVPELAAAWAALAPLRLALVGGVAG